MALNAFLAGPGGNVSIGGSPLAVQVVGPTIVITNVGQNTVYGSMGGSASTTLQETTYINGQAPNTSQAGSNTGVGTNGFAIIPFQPVTISIGGNGWLWLISPQGQSTVNVVNGT